MPRQFHHVKELGCITVGLGMSVLRMGDTAVVDSVLNCDDTDNSDTAYFNAVDII
ncbi:hypothetical protein F5B19DRAFT_480045, partial [Rostrohypoxylon terebratum]